VSGPVLGLARWTDRAQRALERPALLALVLGACYLPFTLLGYGTDIDVANVLRAGESALDGSYSPSRAPGAVPHEVGTAVLDRLGGSVLVNLASVAFAVVALTCLGRLLEAEGVARPGWAVLLLGLNPWWWIAATSLGDFTWALALALLAAVQAREGRRIVAGLLFATAIGCRASSALLLVAWLVAERSGDPKRRVPWADVVRTGAVAVVVGAAWFVPPWLAADRSVRFLDNEQAFAGVWIHGARWAVKNIAVAGVAGTIVLLVGLPVLIAALRSWRTSRVIRFAAVGLVLGQLLFFWLPWKPAHLIPVIACTALLAVRSPAGTARWLGALVASQLLLAAVSVTLAAPDVQDAATGGELDVGVVAGVLVNDVRCRLDDRHRGPRPDPATLEAADRAGELFDCQARAWRAEGPAEIRDGLRGP
jgi:hypothetical protein